MQITSRGALTNAQLRARASTRPILSIYARQHMEDKARIARTQSALPPPPLPPLPFFAAADDDSDDEAEDEDLERGQNAVWRVARNRDTGLGTAAAAFSMPNFFVIDIMHLFFCNIIPLFWQLILGKLARSDFATRRWILTDRRGTTTNFC